MEPVDAMRLPGVPLRRDLRYDDRGFWSDAPAAPARLVDHVNAWPLVAKLYDPVWRARAAGLMTRGRFGGERERSGMASWTAPAGDEVVLDVGCGSGYALRAVHAAYPDARLHGIDRSIPFLVTGHRRLHRDGIEATLLHGDAEDLPYADGSVDAAIFAGTPNEVADRPRALAEIARVLRPGGRLWLMASVRGDGPFADVGARGFAWTGLALPEARQLFDEAVAAGFQAARLEHRPPLAFGRFRLPS